MSAPVITSISPNTGVEGNIVTINGTDFGSSKGTSYVNFEGIGVDDPDGYISWSDTEIVVVAPDSETGYIIVNTSGGGDSNGKLFIYTPSIASISPSQGYSGFQVTINGTHFGSSGDPTLPPPDSGVTFNGLPALRYTLWSPTQIICTAPIDVSNGEVDVIVAGLHSSTTKTFTVLCPEITAVSPLYGDIGDIVTITGTNFGYFQGATGYVTFNGVQSVNYLSWDNTSIMCQIPTVADTGYLTVLTNGGRGLYKFYIGNPAGKMMFDSGIDLIVLEKNFYLKGLGELETLEKFVKYPGMAGGFSVGDKTLNKRLLNIEAEHYYQDLTYFNDILMKLERFRISGILKLYFTPTLDRYFIIDDFKLTHSFVKPFGQTIGDYQLQLTLADPFAYSDTLTDENDDVTGATITAQTLSIPTITSPCPFRPVIRITPASGVLASSIQLGFTSSDGASMSYCLYSDLRMLGDADGNTWVEIDSQAGTVLFTADNGLTMHNAIQYFSGLFPVLQGHSLPTVITYKGNDANIRIKYRVAYFA